MLAISTLARTFEAFGIELDPREVIAPQFHHWHEPPMSPDTPRFLEAAESLGLPVYVGSNIDRSCIDAAMTYHGLAFDAVITSEDVRSYKPHPAVFKAALDRIGLPASEVLHSGDSRTNDVQGAVAAGIAVAWVSRTGKRASGFSRPDYEVSSLDEVIEAWNVPRPERQLIDGSVPLLCPYVR